MPISGFMVVKDVVSGGYPFVEAIRAALPICDELLVSDGYSSDGTWEALEALSARHPRLVLHRDRWDGPRGHAEIIARMTNVLLERCRHDWCLNLQANEVLHERSREELRRLPELYPDAEMFRLPFLTVMGQGLVWLCDHRRRLVRRRPEIRSKGDGYDLGYDVRTFARRRPRELLRYVLHREGEVTAYLSSPVFRYRALYPDLYVGKLERAAALYENAHSNHFVRKELAFARAVRDAMDPARDPVEAFWRRMRVYFDDVQWQGNPHGWSPGRFPRRCLDLELAPPAVMAPLFGAWRYPVEASLAAIA